jgi:hypothetical protein
MQTTYDTSGNREDLSDLISNICPEDTPFFKMVPKTKASNTYHETQKDSLADASENAQLEGWSIGDVTHTTPDRVGGYSQILVKDIEVSDTQRAVNQAGVKDAYNYQVTKRLKEIARDIEFSLIKGTGAAGDATHPRKIKGIMAWMTTNAVDNSGTTALTEDAYNELLDTVWQQGGHPNVTLVNSKLKRAISGFTAGSTKNVDSKAKKLIASVDVYESDFGLQKIVLERYINNDDVAVLEKDLWEVAFLRKTKHVPLAKVGDSTRGYVRAELALVARNEAGNGKIENCKIA